MCMFAVVPMSPCSFSCSRSHTIAALFMSMPVLILGPGVHVHVQARAQRLEPEPHMSRADWLTPMILAAQVPGLGIGEMHEKEIIFD